MRRIPYFFPILVLLVAFGLIVNSAYVSAITYGFVDENNTFSNVGAFIIKRNRDGQIFPICTGTLIAPDVFLTAAHCTDFFEKELAPFGFTAFVSFDNPIRSGQLTDLRTTRLVPVTRVVTNPNYTQAQNESGDIAVLLVSSRDTKGITPATLPTAGLFDQLAAQNGLKDTVFTAVGYGLQNREVGGGPPFFNDANPVPRMFSFSVFDALNGGYIRLSQNPALGNGGTCYGDSGGPNFLQVNGKQILGAITITGDTPCQSTNVDLRLDTVASRNFLAPYVTLP